MPAGADDGGEEETNEATASEGRNMKYQKPKVVAKSAPKLSFVAGCPEKTAKAPFCHSANNDCLCGQLN